MFSRTIITYAVVMFFSPVVGAIASFFQSNRGIRKWALILFVTLYGSVLLLTESRDGYRHRQNVYDHYVDLELDQFLVELKEHLSFQFNPETNDEPYIHIISYFVGSILGLPGLFFTLVAFIYGYFFVSSLFQLFEVFPTWKKSPVFFIYAILFLMWISLYAISTVRTWTGFWVLFYACLSYYKTRSIKYIVLMFVPPFIHIGYWAMAIPAWGVLFFGNWKWIYAGIFFISFATTLVNPTVALNQIATTEIGESKVDAYYVDEESSSSEVMENYSTRTWYKQLTKVGIQKLGIWFIAGLFIVSGTYFSSMTRLESRMFSIGILTAALSNLSWFLFALKVRSARIAGAFILATLLLLWQRGYFNQELRKVKSQERFLAYCLLFFFAFLIYSLAQLIEFYSIFLFFIPFLPWISEGVNISIREFLGMLLGV